MLVISSREFRANQGKYLGLAADGEDIVLKSRSKGSFKLVPITSDDSFMSKEDFYAKIDRSIQQAKEGKVTAQRQNETVEEFIERLLCTD